MKLKLVLAVSLLTAGPLLAQEKAAAPALPQGWTMKLDRENAIALSHRAVRRRRNARRQ